MTQVFTIPGWIVAIPTLLAVVAAVVALALLAQKKKKTLRPLAVIPLGVAALLGGCCAPTLYNDQVTVTDTKVEQRTGFWFAPNVKGFSYKGVKSVQILDRPTGPKGRLAESWEVHYADGRVHVIDPGDLWEVNGAEIRALCEKRGVTFE